jgi:hypothetical protein
MLVQTAIWLVAMGAILFLVAGSSPSWLFIALSICQKKVNGF